jgi:hypothetical protein
LDERRYEKLGKKHKKRLSKTYEDALNDWRKKEEQAIDERDEDGISERVENYIASFGIPRPAVYMLTFISFTIGSIILLMIALVVFEALNSATIPDEITTTTTSSIDTTTTSTSTTTTSTVSTSTTTSSSTTTTIWYGECKSDRDCPDETYYSCRRWSFYRLVSDYGCIQGKCVEKDVWTELIDECSEDELCDDEVGCIEGEPLTSTSTSTTSTTQSSTTTTTISTTTTSTSSTTTTSTIP